MQGFKEFLTRGNLIELAVAFIIGSVFAAVVTEFTGIIMSVISAILGGPPKVDDMVAAGVQIGPFINSVITFVLTAAVVYFLVVLPYNKFRDRRRIEEPEVSATSEELLTEIRDLLRTR